MSEVAALIADMVRAGVDADLIGRTAAALSAREPVFVPVTGEADDAMATDGHGGRSVAARRQARYRARRAAKPAEGRNAGVTRYVTRDGEHDAEETGGGPVNARKTVDQAAGGDAFDHNEASRGVTGDVTRYGAAEKENTPQTPQEKKSPLKEKAPKGAQKKAPPETAEAGLFAGEPEPGHNADLGADLETDLGADPGREPGTDSPSSAGNGAAPGSVSTAGARARRRGGDIAGLMAEFDAHVWPLYPQKVARKTALKAWASARQRADFDTIMAGLKRYVAKRDDRPWCNLSTWLNQDRWTDRPAASSPSQARSPPRPSGTSRSEQIREHNRRVQETLRKRMRQDNGNSDDIGNREAGIIDIDRSDWTAHGSPRSGP
ncbi:MAG: hypothetical protein ABGX47_12305 [Martelella sp.]|uniref:hypothetical protein n=1 Tax=Martelella sp. TaxID=1969699 RepID=UPI00324252FF